MRHEIIVDTSYYRHGRTEILALIPSSARRVLDVGCGGGELGRLLKQRQLAEVVGIEMNSDAVELARKHLDSVYLQRIEDPALVFSEQQFDCIVCADILEHVVDPAAVLRKLGEWLHPNGTLVASIPNVRHHSILKSLLNGNWTYESQGILDSDHVRFFTRREVEKLFYRSGFHVSQVSFVSSPDYGPWLESGRPSRIDVGGLQLQCANSDDASEWFAFQYLVVARPEAPTDHGLTSIVILTHNELGYTRLCVDSLLARTDEPIELIFVDNGSTDGTVEYLQGLRGVKVIYNGENRGFPAGVNQALRIASGENIALLNNDTIVTTGWLKRMLDVLHSDSKIGLVGPSSNWGNGPQAVAVQYRDLASIDGFAWDFGKLHRGKVEETHRLIGFCLLMRRSVFEEIGFFDEQFGLGCFEDDDYCIRALRKGWRLVISREVFVHHFGSRTFIGRGVDYTPNVLENRQKFLNKWESLGLSIDGQGAGVNS